MKFFAQWIVFVSVFLWTQQVFSQASNTIQISDAYARATSPGQVVGAGYLTISNLANTNDRLLSASFTRVGQVQIHEMKMEGDRMMMRELNGLEIPAKGSAQLKPGGNHLMFMQLKEPFKEGEVLQVQLQFEKAGKVDIKLPIKAIGHSGMGHSKNHSVHTK